jgi:hypothetical protein
MKPGTIVVITICAFLLFLFFIFLLLWFFHPTFKYDLTLHRRKNKPAIIPPPTIRIIHPSNIDTYKTEIPIIPKQPVFTYDDEKTHKNDNKKTSPTFETYQPYQPQKFTDLPPIIYDDTILPEKIESNPSYSSSGSQPPLREKHTWRDPKTYEQFTESELKVLNKSKKQPTKQPTTSLEKHMAELENRPIFLLTDPVDI